MKAQFPDVVGFQPPTLAQNLSFKRIEGPYVQIIHTNGNHWITVAGIHGSLVKVYDSKYKSLSEDTARQIACLTAADKKHITIHLENTQFQKGSTTCGLYAIAFATEICFGNNPASYRSVFSDYHPIGKPLYILPELSHATVHASSVKNSHNSLFSGLDNMEQRRALYSALRPHPESYIMHTA